MEPPAPIPAADARAERLRVRPWSVAALVLVLVGATVVRNLVAAAHQPIAWALASVSIAILLAPVVVLLDRYVHRATAIFLTLIVLAATVVGLVLALFSDLRDEISGMRDLLPAAAADVEDHDRFGDAARDFQLQERVEALVDSIEERVSGRVAVERAIGTAPTFLVNAVLVVFFLVWGARMWQGALSQIGNSELRERTSATTLAVVGRTRRYVHLMVAHALVVGGLVAVVARTLELPAAAVLGLITGVFSLVPYIGIVFGGLPVILLAAAFEPLQVTAALLVGVLLIQVASIVFTRGFVHPRSVRVGPAAIVVLALIGLDLYGLGGAMFGGLVAVVLVTLADVLGSDGI